jgi:predicted ATPase/DNA-binding SARP family transcriptional activator
MEIRLLGPLEVVADDGASVAIHGVRLQTLLATLALRSGTAVSVDRLIDDVWGEDPPDQPSNALQRHVSTLRRLLGGETVERRGTTYVLQVDESCVDVRRFEELDARARDAAAAGDPAHARSLFVEALRLWRGDALVDLAGVESMRPEVTRLSESRLGAIEARIDADLALGDHNALVGELEGLVATHPLREHFWAQLMLALARSGRQAEALRAFQSARALLRDELGLEPSEELRAVEAAILEQQDAVGVGRGAAAERPRARLPTPLTSLIGREQEVRDLVWALDQARLVTIVGPGGSGKTRLAIEVARVWHAHASAAVWFVELAGVANSEGIVPAVAAALEVSVGADDSASIARIAQLLERRPALLVLDNCEHLVEGAATIAHEFLETCPTLRILSTSRESLAVMGEIVRAIPPLSLADGISLFVERAGAISPRVAVEAEHSSDESRLLEQLCTELDGLPLAVELAAARVRTMSLATLVAELTDRFRILTRGDRTAPARQQTLRATVDWSYNLLSEDERRVFERLSVFSAGCSLEAARAVCADDSITPDDVEDIVQRLVDKSLVVAKFEGVHTRYDLLQTLLHYGHERLVDSGDATRRFRAHMEYFAALCARGAAAQRGTNQREWLRMMSTDTDNVRSALTGLVNGDDRLPAQTATGALGWFWWLAGRATEGSRWMAAAASSEPDTPAFVRARLLAWSCYLGIATAEGGAAATPNLDELVDEALTLYREAGAVEELAEMSSILAVMYSTRGNRQRMQQLMFDAEELLRRIDQTPRTAAALAWISARRALYEGRNVDAEAGFQSATELLAAIDDEALCAFTAMYLARLAMFRGDTRASIAVLEQGLVQARELGLLGLADLLTTDLGDALAVDGQIVRARAMLNEARTTGRDLVFLPGYGRPLIALALLERREGNEEAARLAATEALGLVIAGDNRDGIAHCLAILGFLAETRGDVETARRHHLRGLTYASETGEKRSLALALEGLAGIKAHDGDGLEAARLLGAAETLRRSVTWRTGWSVASAEQGDVDRITANAVALVGPGPFDDAFQRGLSDPEGLLSDLRMAATVG